MRLIPPDLPLDESLARGVFSKPGALTTPLTAVDREVSESLSIFIKSGVLLPNNVVAL